MTVPSDGSPRRLFEQSIPTAGGSPSLAADSAALRQLVEAIVQETLTREFTQFLGAAPHERTDERRGVRNGTRPRTGLHEHLLIERASRSIARSP